MAAERSQTRNHPTAKIDKETATKFKWTWFDMKTVRKGCNLQRVGCTVRSCVHMYAWSNFNNPAKYVVRQQVERERVNFDKFKTFGDDGLWELADIKKHASFCIPVQPISGLTDSDCDSHASDADPAAIRPANRFEAATMVIEILHQIATQEPFFLFATGNYAKPKKHIRRYGIPREFILAQCYEQYGFQRVEDFDAAIHDIAIETAYPKIADQYEMAVFVPLKKRVICTR